jgi:hypothetical protein
MNTVGSTATYLNIYTAIAMHGFVFWDYSASVERSLNSLANIVAAMFRVNDFATDFGSRYSPPILTV